MPAIIDFPRVVQEALGDFGDLFANEPQRRHFAEYLTGLFVAARKTVTGINAQFAHLGGGFGGRDHTPFPLYVALAAIFFPGRPIRLAQDRYQQFQGGIKRHAFKMHSRLGVDRASCRMTAFAADHVLDGGGLANYSASVAVVGATGAIGIYDIPKVLHAEGLDR